MNSSTENLLLKQDKDEEQKLSKEIQVQLLDNNLALSIDYITDNQTGEYFSDQFDPFKIPPNLDLARKHGIAMRVCKPIDIVENKELCPCCGLPTENELISLSCHPDELGHIGTCYPQYFSFIKLCLIILLIHLSIQALPALIINQLYGNQCLDQNNSQSFICTTSYVNIQSEKNKGLIKTQCILNFITIFVLIIAVELMKIYQRQHRYRLEINRLSVSDYSILISKLPQIVDSKTLESFLDSKLEGCSKNIEKVFMFFDVKLYALLIKRRQNNFQKMVNLLRKIEIQDYKQENYETKILQYRNKLQNLNKEGKYLIERKKSIEDKFNLFNEIDDLQIPDENQFNQDTLKMLPFSGKILIIFKDCQTVKQLTKQFKNNFKEKIYIKFNLLFKKQVECIKEKYKFKNNIIKLKKAPEPSDIIWSNIGSINKKFAARILSYLISYGLIGISFLLLLFIKKMIKSEQQQVNTISSLILSFIASTLVAGTNTLMGIVIRRCTIYEEHNKQTTYFISTGQKLTKLFAINMILTTLMANVINSLTVTNKTFTINIMECFNDFFFLFITNSYLSSLFAIFDIVWGYRLFQRYQIEKQGNQTNVCQIQANYYYEGHPIDMALRYANVLKTVMFTAAVSPLIPGGVLLSIVGLCILYWADKYLLLRRFVCSNFITYKLPKKMMSYLHISTIFFSLGNLVIMFVPIQSEFGYKWPDFEETFYFYLAVIGVAMALFFNYTPLKGIYQLYTLLFGEQLKKKVNKLTYQEVQNKLKEDYDYYHPVYREYAIRETLDQNQINTDKKKFKRSQNSDIKGLLRSIRHEFDTIEK